MLLITTIVNSSILIPSYFIMRQYATKNYALVGSIAITVLPCLVLYNFTLMCENLLMPLFIFSIWFVHEAFRTRARFWIIAAVLSIILLFFTKHSGFAMLFGLAASVIYYIISEQKYEIVRSKFLLRYAFILAITSLLIYKTIIDNTIIGVYIEKELNTLINYLIIFVNMLGNISSQNKFLSLLLHELEYLMISSYFVIFIIAALLLLYLFNITKGYSLHIIDYENLVELKKDKALKSSIIYFLFSGISLVIAVVLFMHQMMQNLPEGYSFLYLCNRDDFQLMGRYIEPLVPAIFLYGLIALNRISGQKKEKRSKMFLALVIAYLAISSLFSLTFPFTTNKDAFPIIYLTYLESLMPTWAIVPVILPLFFVGLYLSLFDQRSKSILLVISILSSLIISAYTIPWELAASKGFQDQNQIGSYLEEFSNDSTLILMDKEDDMRDRVMLPFTKFWARGKVVTHSSAKDPSGVYSDYARNVSYIISSKILPYQPIAFSTKGFRLYKQTRIADNASLYGIDKTDGWNYMELWNGLPANWMKSNATLTIYSDRDLQANLSFNVLSFHTKRRLQIFYNDILVTSAIVPTDFIAMSVPIDLKCGMNQVRFNVPEGCNRPLDIAELNNSDNRCLSLGIQNLTIYERKDNIISGREQSDPMLISGWHDAENWNATTTHWMEADATVTIYSEESRDAILRFQAQSFVRPRSLEISSDALSNAKFAVTTNFVNITEPIHLIKGLNLLVFHIPEGCEKPCDIPELNNPDCRCLSMAVQNLNIT
jgi:hypothetical protein